MRKFLLATLSASFILSGTGCSSVKFSCPYGESCADITDIYHGSLSDHNPKGWSVTNDPTLDKKSNNSNNQNNDLSILDEDFSNKNSNDKKNKSLITKKKLKEIQTDSLQGAVYHPAKPYQIWLFDSTHILHSGSYAWFTTPSYWTYGGFRFYRTRHDWK